MSRDRLPHLILPVAALICIVPLLLQGPSCGHDFTFHLTNWFEAAAQFSHGTFHPEWAVSPAWNAGEPRFVFYPPLSWTLGALLGLILPWTWTPIVYTWLALTASGLAMYRLARAHAAPAAALVASTLYLANPYMLFTAYERTAYAELLASAFLPLLVHAILKPRPTVPTIAIPLALLWITNAPAAVMGTYTLALLALIRLAQSHKQRVPKARVLHRLQPHRDGWGLSPTPLAATTAAGTLLGLGLAAFYILPAATERPLVQIAMAVIPGMRIDDNTLFHHTGTSEDAIAHDAVLQTASLIALILLTITATSLIIAGTRRGRPSPSHSSTQAPSVPTLPKHSSRQDGPRLPLTILTAIIALLLTPLALPVWHHAPELAFLQFPWRLLAVQAVVFSLAITLLPTPRSQHPIPHLRQTPSPLGDRPPTNSGSPTLPIALTALILAALLTAAAWPTFRQPCDTTDTVLARLAAFQIHRGAEPTDEYTPTAADNDSLHPNNPPFWLAPGPDAPPPRAALPGPAPRELTLLLPTPQYLILNLRQFPAWHVALNGQNLTARALTQTPRADGLLNLPLRAGPNHLLLTYQTTPLEHTADGLSAFSLLLTIAMLRLPRRLR